MRVADSSSHPRFHPLYNLLFFFNEQNNELKKTDNNRKKKERKKGNANWHWIIASENG